MDDKFLASFDKLTYQKAETKNSESLVEIFTRQAKVILTVVFMFIYEVIVGAFAILKPAKPKDISGQLCLVTGGANGLGRCLAMRFAQERCRIAVVDIVNSESTVKEIKETFGVNCQGFYCDLANTKLIAKMKEEVEAAMGPVDILVNNAGLLYVGSMLKCNMDSARKCVDVNLTSHFDVSKILKCVATCFHVYSNR